MRVGLERVFFVLALAAASSACSPFDQFKAEDGTALDASLRAPASSTGDGGSDCEPVLPPRRPGVLGAGDAIGFVAAVRTVDLGDGDGGDGVPNFLGIGFDLDTTCSGQGAGSSCVAPPWVTYHLDGPGGRDNSFGSILYQLNQNGGGSATESNNSNTAVGVGTAVIRVRNYNGTSIDNQIEVGWYGATMYRDLTVPPAPPVWDGSDEWLAFDAWVDGIEVGDAGPIETGSEPSPKYYDSNAYVTDGYLVARFPEFLISIGMMTEAIIMARLERNEAGAWTLRAGTIAGRLAIDDTVRGLENVRDDSTGDWICTDSPAYPARKQLLCGLADISASGIDDGSSPCDAVSWAWTFEAEPAKLSGVQDTDIAIFRNCDEDVRPENDQCATLAEQFPSRKPSD